MTGFDSFFGGTTASDALRWLEDCEQAADVAPHNGGPKPEFNEWERSFIRSARSRVVAGSSLTTKQIDVLRGLWERI